MQLIFNCITVYSDTMSHIAHTGPSWNHILGWQWADPIMSYYDMFTFVFLPFFPDHSGGGRGPFNPTVCQLLLKSQWPGGHSLRGVIHSSDTVLHRHPRVAKYTCVYDVQLLAIWHIPLHACSRPPPCAHAQVIFYLQWPDHFWNARCCLCMVPTWSGHDVFQFIFQA